MRRGHTGGICAFAQARNGSAAGLVHAARAGRLHKAFLPAHTARTWSRAITGERTKRWLVVIRSRECVYRPLKRLTLTVPCAAAWAAPQQFRQPKQEIPDKLMQVLSWVRDPIRRQAPAAPMKRRLGTDWRYFPHSCSPGTSMRTTRGSVASHLMSFKSPPKHTTKIG